MECAAGVWIDRANAVTKGSLPDRHQLGHQEDREEHAGGSGLPLRPGLPLPVFGGQVARREPAQVAQAPQRFGSADVVRGGAQVGTHLSALSDPRFPRQIGQIGVERPHRAFNTQPVGPGQGTSHVRPPRKVGQAAQGSAGTAPG